MNVEEFFKWVESQLGVSFGVTMAFVLAVLAAFSGAFAGSVWLVYLTGGWGLIAIGASPFAYLWLRFKWSRR